MSPGRDQETVQSLFTSLHYGHGKLNIQSLYWICTFDPRIQDSWAAVSTAPRHMISTTPSPPTPAPANNNMCKLHLITRHLGHLQIEPR